MTTSPRDPDTHARHPHLPAEETGALVDATIAALTQITGAPPEESFVLVRTMIDRPPTQVAIDDLIADDPARIENTPLPGNPFDPALLIAVTRNRDLGGNLLNRARLHLETPIAARIIVHERTWHDIDTGDTGYLSPPPTAAPNQQATPRGHDLTTALATGEATWQHDVLSSIENLTAEREWITATVAHAIATGRPLTDTAATRMLLDIANNDLRDHAVAGIDHRSARTHVDLWADLTARAPAPYRDAPATLTAHTLWLDSQPDDARNALALAPNRERYVLAQLIDGALDMNLDPRQAISPPVPLVWPPPDRPRPAAGRSHHHAASVNLSARPHPSHDIRSAFARDYGPPA